jgi:hypothetical protein
MKKTKVLVIRSTSSFHVQVNDAINAYFKLRKCFGVKKFHFFLFQRKMLHFRNEIQFKRVQTIPGSINFQHNLMSQSLFRLEFRKFNSWSVFTLNLANFEFLNKSNSFMSYQYEMHMFRVSKTFFLRDFAIKMFCRTFYLFYLFSTFQKVKRLLLSYFKSR